MILQVNINLMETGRLFTAVLFQRLFYKTVVKDVLITLIQATYQHFFKRYESGSCKRC